MSDKTYKKTYKGFLIWMLLIFSLMLIVPALQLVIKDNDILTKVVLLLIFWLMDLLLFIIYKGEYVYWFSGGPDFETAKAAGTDRRKNYAFRHLKIFLKASTIYTVYMVVSLSLCFHIGWDISLFAIALVSAAFCTVGIKL